MKFNPLLCFIILLSTSSRRRFWSSLCPLVTEVAWQYINYPSLAKTDTDFPVQKGCWERGKIFLCVRFTTIHTHTKRTNSQMLLSISHKGWRNYQAAILNQRKWKVISYTCEIGDVLVKKNNCGGHGETPENYLLLDSTTSMHKESWQAEAVTFWINILLIHPFISITAEILVNTALKKD